MKMIDIFPTSSRELLWPSCSATFLSVFSTHKSYKNVKGDLRSFVISKCSKREMHNQHVQYIQNFNLTKNNEKDLLSLNIKIKI